MSVGKWICRVVCVVTALAATAAVLLLVYTFVERPSSGGFLDLTNLARGFYLGGAVVFGGVAALCGKFGWKSRTGQ